MCGQLREPRCALSPTPVTDLAAVSSVVGRCNRLELEKPVRLDFGIQVAAVSRRGGHRRSSHNLAQPGGRCIRCNLQPRQMLRLLSGRGALVTLALTWAASTRWDVAGAVRKERVGRALLCGLLGCPQGEMAEVTVGCRFDRGSNRVTGGHGCVERCWWGG